MMPALRSIWYCLSAWYSERIPTPIREDVQGLKLSDWVKSLSLIRLPVGQARAKTVVDEMTLVVVVVVVASSVAVVVLETVEVLVTGLATRLQAELTIDAANVVNAVGVAGESSRLSFAGPLIVLTSVVVVVVVSVDATTVVVVVAGTVVIGVVYPSRLEQNGCRLDEVTTAAAMET